MGLLVFLYLGFPPDSVSTIFSLRGVIYPPSLNSMDLIILKEFYNRPQCLGHRTCPKPYEKTGIIILMGKCHYFSDIIDVIVSRSILLGIQYRMR